LLEQIEGEIRAALSDIAVVTHLEPLEDSASYAHDQLGHSSRASQKMAGNDEPSPHREKLELEKEYGLRPAVKGCRAA